MRRQCLVLDPAIDCVACNTQVFHDFFSRCPSLDRLLRHLVGDALHKSDNKACYIQIQYDNRVRRVITTSRSAWRGRFDVAKPRVCSESLRSICELQVSNWTMNVRMPSKDWPFRKVFRKPRSFVDLLPGDCPCRGILKAAAPRFPEQSRSVSRRRCSDRPPPPPPASESPDRIVYSILRADSGSTWTLVDSFLPRKAALPCEDSQATLNSCFTASVTLPG
jgi:hypothetical protein